MTFKVSDNQYGRLHPSDSWASCLISATFFTFLTFYGIFFVRCTAFYCRSTGLELSCPPLIQSCIITSFRFTEELTLNSRCPHYFSLMFIVFPHYYLRQGKRSEHWRRLRDWSFCPSFRVCTR